MIYRTQEDEFESSKFREKHRMLKKKKKKQITLLQLFWKDEATVWSKVIPYHFEKFRIKSKDNLAKLMLVSIFC